VRVAAWSDVRREQLEEIMNNVNRSGRGRRVSAVACAMLIALAGEARADTITIGNFFQLPAASGGGNPTQSTVFFIPRFDAALGTLDAIEFDLIRGVLNFAWTVDNESSFSSVLTTAQPAVSTRLAWLGGELAEFPQQVTLGPPYVAVSADTDGAPDFAGGDAETLTGAFPLLAQNVTLVDPVLLAAFTGAGTVPLEERARFLPSSPGPGIFFHDATLNQATGGVVWRYHYTPSADPPLPPRPVPEPGSAAFLLAGLGVVVYRVRATVHGRASSSARTRRSVYSAPSVSQRSDNPSAHRPTAMRR
jgi:hypothetical protein